MAAASCRGCLELRRTPRGTFLDATLPAKCDEQNIGAQFVRLGLSNMTGVGPLAWLTARLSQPFGNSRKPFRGLARCQASALGLFDSSRGEGY